MQTTFKIGHDPDFPPFGWRTGQESRGWLVELVGAALARARAKTEFVTVPLPRLTHALEAGEIDGIAFHAIMREQGHGFDYSAPLLASGGAWFLPDGIAWPDGAPPDGARIATPARGPLADELERRFPNAAVVRVTDYPAALNAVLDGEADAAALNLHVGAYLARRDFAGRFELPHKPFLAIDMGFCCRAGEHGALLSAFDDALAALRKEGVDTELERKYGARAA